MLKEIDAELERRGLEAIIVEGDSTIGNPDLRYVAGAELARGGIYLKKLREEPVLIVSSVDVRCASKGHVKKVKTYADYGYELLLKEDRRTAKIKLYEKILKEHNIKGAVCLYGRSSVSDVIYLVDGLRKLGHDVKGEASPSLIEVLRETKDPYELEKIREVGEKTQRVMEKAIEFLSSLKMKEGVLSYDGEPLKVQGMKRQILHFLAEEAINPIGEPIFAVGKGSSDPHYSGEEELVRSDEPIVLDLFTYGKNGYCFDCTRTFVLGRAPYEVKRMFDSVQGAQQLAFDMLKEGAIAKEVVNRVCDFFERKGYKTIRSIERDRDAMVRGFIHSLGHGIGLSIGERPYLAIHSDDLLKEGQVITVEPGLYDPSIGGVRLEDVVVIRKDSPLNLTYLKKELEY